MKKLCLTTILLIAAPLALRAGHHTIGHLAVASPKCGWIEGENVRDFSNLAEFCARWVPAGVRIAGATARGGHLWIEAPPDFLENVPSETGPRALLADWLQRWKTVTGYRTAFVTVLQGHRQIAKAQTTLTGDVVSMR
jgi:hypothetical protein